MLRTSPITNMFKNARKLFSQKSGFQLTTESVGAAMKGLQDVNHIEEHNPNLTADEKLKMKRFLIYRSDPSYPDDEPRLMSYYIDLNRCAPMYLDALIKIKDEYDSSLSFRRSCREGVCGSCAMSIDGKHTLACLKAIDKDISKSSTITPLGHMFVVKDLVVDMTNFYAQYKTIQPFLKRKTPKKPNEKEYYQSEEDRAKLDGLYECVLCASCSTSCPSYWWHPDKYLGPAVLMQAYRWIVDSRDEYKDERLEYLSTNMKVSECQNIGMCSATCPKDLDPRAALQDLLKMIKEYQQKRGDTEAL